MAIVRRVFGPFGFHEENPGTSAHEMRWGFIGIRGDRTTAHWTLIFKPHDRKFAVGTSQLGLIRGGTAHKVTRSLPADYPVENVHPDAFLDGRPVEEGAIRDILKKRLTRKDIAAVTAAMITRR